MLLCLDVFQWNKTLSKKKMLSSINLLVMRWHKSLCNKTEQIGAAAGEILRVQAIWPMAWINRPKPVLLLQSYSCWYTSFILYSLYTIAYILGSSSHYNIFQWIRVYAVSQGCWMTSLETASGSNKILH